MRTTLSRGKQSTFRTAAQSCLASFSFLYFLCSVYWSIHYRQETRCHRDRNIHTLKRKAGPGVGIILSRKSVKCWGFFFVAVFFMIPRFALSLNTHLCYLPYREVTNARLSLTDIDRRNERLVRHLPGQRVT